MSLDIPLVPRMIHRPDAPAHMMRAKPMERTVRVVREGEVLAEGRPLQVIEIGRDVYDPVYYFHRSDVRAELEDTPKSTHCPLKGDTTYLDVNDVGAIAWSYTKPLKLADILRDRVAFDAGAVEITLLPA